MEQLPHFQSCTILPSHHSIAVLITRITPSELSTLKRVRTPFHQRAVSSCRAFLFRSRTMSSKRTSLEYSFDSFGPTVSKGFDFTLPFQDSVLSLLPSVFLLILPSRIWSLHSKLQKVHRSHIYESKLVRCEIHPRLTPALHPSPSAKDCKFTEY